MATTCQIGRLSVERDASAFGIHHAAPRISWRFEGDAVDWKQASYDLRLEGPLRQLKRFHGDSEASVLVDWPFSPLRSRERVTLHVRATSTAGISTDWAALNLEAGLLDSMEWSAALTLAGPQLAAAPKRPFLLRKRFVLPTSFKTARLYSSALGLYEISINGTVVGDHVLSPGWQSYKYRLHYQTFDISEYLKPGDNDLVAWVAEGWYAGRLGWGEGRRNVYGSEPGLLAQVEVDGQALVLTGDDGWEWAFGPLLSSELYDGETVDLNTPEGPWQAARRAFLPSVSLIAPESPPIRRKQVITAVEHRVSPSGASILDFGQNLVGWIRIRRTPPSDTTLVFRHAEVLENEELGVRPLRHAKAIDSVRVGEGSAALGWEPKFTFHGFRYVQVNGWPNLDIDCIEAVVVHTDMERLGDFACSHSWLTKFHENTVWGLRGNFVSVPTDCPQRDERLGWTGDLQVFCPTASFLYDTAGMLSHWLQDLALEQLNDHDGVPPQVVPNVLSSPPKPFAIWADAAVLTPWDQYRAFGDIRVLKDQWESMAAWLDRGVRRAPSGLWDPSVQQLGDWLDPAAPEDTPDDSHSDSILVANAFLIRATEVAASVAAVLGRTNDAGRYRDDYERLLGAFRNEYVSPNGRVVSDTQTTLALALHFGLLPPASRQHAADRLDHLIRRRAFTIGTGFAGTPVILSALAAYGHSNTAYRMFQNKQCPSLLYPISVGATTIWERWNSMLPDGSINPGEMTSFNHYALGAVSMFLYQTVGGISPLLPGWKRALIRPSPGGTVTWAEVSHVTPYGKLSCKWRIRGQQLAVDVEVPPNTTARVELPGIVVEKGSGVWDFVVPWEGNDVWPPKVLQPPPLRPQLVDEIVA